jgi:hypothetical protein
MKFLAHDFRFQQHWSLSVDGSFWQLDPVLSLVLVFSLIDILFFEMRNTMYNRLPLFICSFNINYSPECLVSPQYGLVVVAACRTRTVPLSQPGKQSSRLPSPPPGKTVETRLKWKPSNKKVVGFRASSKPELDK